MQYCNPIEIDGKLIGSGLPVYFIADIAANHDGDLQRAKHLIKLAKEAGADAAKFQHFHASTIVSDCGFQHLEFGSSHQQEWKESVFQVYRNAEVHESWTEQLVKTCKEVGITFMTTPYSFSIAEYVSPYVPAFKIGSGDITWTSLIEYIGGFNKPVLLASGASSLDDVDRALRCLHSVNNQIVLMQCNTNYTGLKDNLKYSNLNTLGTFSTLYPGLPLGLSDHTAGHIAVLGAVALGACVVEKHFTDDQSRVGPDHGFSLSPKEFGEMVRAAGELWQCLGDGVKRIESNENETVIIQRRAVCASTAIAAGEKVTKDNTTVLRPCPPGAIHPYQLEGVLGRIVLRPIQAGEHLTWSNLQ